VEGSQPFFFFDFLIFDFFFFCVSHGYLQASGLPELFTVYVQMNTAEGENHILTQQCARYLIRVYNQSLTGEKCVGTCEYLSNSNTAGRCSAKKSHDFLDFNIQLNAMTHRSKRLIGKLAKSTTEFSENLIEVDRVAFAHCETVVVLNFIRALSELKDSPIKGVLKNLSDLFFLYKVEQHMGDFLEDGYFTTEHAEWIREEEKSTLRLIRQNAVSLVDAFNYSDHALCSALGRQDGQVYQALYDFAQLDPANKSDISPVYQKYIRPILKLHENQKSHL